GRRRAVDLLLARREFSKHSRISEALSGRAGVQDRNELPECSGNSGGGERCDCRKRATIPEALECDTRITGAEAGLGGTEQWRGTSAVYRATGSRIAR